MDVSKLGFKSEGYEKKENVINEVISWFKKNGNEYFGDSWGKRVFERDSKELNIENCEEFKKVMIKKKLWE